MDKGKARSDMRERVYSREWPISAHRFGDINTYAIFAESFLAATRDSGRAGFIVPTGIATDDTTKAFFERLISSSD